MRIEEAKIKNSLKKLMKKNGLHYVDVAKSLGVSSATIKRRLNNGELNISQLMELSECLGVTLYELIEFSRSDSSSTHMFTEDQENLFAKDLGYLLLFRECVKGLGFNEIRLSMNLKDQDLRKRLRRLEEMHLIKLMPKDRILLLAKFPYKWRENGALQKAYFAKNIQSLFEHVQRNYQTSFYQEDTGVLCKPFELLLSPESFKSFSHDLNEIYLKYINISQIEMKSKSKKSLTVSGLLMCDSFSIWGVKGAKEIRQSWGELIKDTKAGG